MLVTVDHEVLMTSLKAGAHSTRSRSWFIRIWSRLLALFISPFTRGFAVKTPENPTHTASCRQHWMAKTRQDLSQKMPDIYAQLRQEIATGDVLRPDDAGYKESLRRWSTSSERPAVRTGLSPTNNRSLYRVLFLKCTEVS